MELSDLEPKEVSLNLEGVEVVFRPFTLRDELRNKKKFGGEEGLQKIIAKFDFEKISEIAWGQVTLESKKVVVKAVQVSGLDPTTGEEIKVEMLPLDKFQTLLLGIPALIRLLEMLNTCKGVNLPKIDDLKKATDQPQP